MTPTYGQSLAKALALDAHDGNQNYSDAVLFGMLDRIGRRARGELPQTAPRASRLEREGRETRRAPARLLIQACPATLAPLAKSRPAAAVPASKKPPQRTWTKAEVAAALQDGVLGGRVSGTAAVAALKSIAGMHW